MLVESACGHLYAKCSFLANQLCALLRLCVIDTINDFHNHSAHDKIIFVGQVVLDNKHLYCVDLIPGAPFSSPHLT